jgi:hypothetical protein
VKHTPIPEPRIGPRRVFCPDCERSWPRGQRTRYDLHWRITHDANREAPRAPTPP